MSHATAPVLAQHDVDWRAVLVDGLAAQGVHATVSGAAPTTCGCWECVCPDGTHLWLTPAAAAREVTR